MGAATNNNRATTVQQIFIAAKWILQNVGWCQKFYFTAKSGTPMPCAFTPGAEEPGRRIPESYPDLGACDLMGAISMVEADPYLRGFAQGTLEQIVTSDRSAAFPLNIWNDKPERTLEDVLALLDKAIKTA